MVHKCPFTRVQMFTIPIWGGYRRLATWCCSKLVKRGVLEHNQLLVSSTYHLSAYRDKQDGTAPYTLQSRILKYLRTSDKYKKCTLTSNKDNSQTLTLNISYCNEFMVKKTFREFSHNQLLEFIHELSKNEIQLPRKTIDDLIQLADKECSYRFKNMDKEIILKCLDAWFYVLPQRITNLEFYSLFLSQVYFWVIDSNFPLDYLIPLMFYIGLQKKNEQARRILSRCLILIDATVNLDDITIEDLCILLNATYKTSTKITSIKLLKSTCYKIDSNLSSILLDSPIFVTLIKSLRHAQYHNVDLLCKTANILTSKKSILKSYNFTGKSHLLAFYAESLYSKPNLINLLINSSVKYLSLDCKVKSKQSDYLSFKPRVKDISMFLWAVSYLGYVINQKVMEDIILPLLMERLKQGEFDKKPEEITSSLLSIWTMGYKPVILFERAVTKKEMRKMKEMGRFRQNSRLALLLYCIKTEMPHLLNKEHFEWISTCQVSKTNLDKHIQKREFFQKVYIAVKCLASHLEIGNLTCDFNIPYLYIAGITVRTSRGCVVNIEVLDPTVCLYGSHSPHGLMKLKLRLLKALGNEVIAITQQQFEYLDDTSNLYVHLEDKLMKFS